jgi:hypothetical protein
MGARSRRVAPFVKLKNAAALSGCKSVYGICKKIGRGGAGMFRVLASVGLALGHRAAADWFALSEIAGIAGG